MELLQVSYFSRRPGVIVGVDLVEEMLPASARNLKEAEEKNAWFDSSFWDGERAMPCIIRWRTNLPMWQHKIVFPCH